MKRFMPAALIASTLGVFVSTAQAQIGSYQRPQIGPGYRPAVSPYLNLARPGGVAGNYYNLTRPQVDAFRSIGQLQTGVQTLQTQQQLLTQQGQLAGGLGGLPPGLGSTGHPVGFFNYGQYYTFPFPRMGPAVTGVGGTIPGTAAMGNTGAGSATNLLGAPPGGTRQPSFAPFIGIRAN